MKKTSKFLNLIISLLGLILIFQACQSPNTTNEIKSKAEFVNTKNLTDLNKDPFSGDKKAFKIKSTARTNCLAKPVSYVGGPSVFGGNVSGDGVITGYTRIPVWGDNLVSVRSSAISLLDRFEYYGNNSGRLSGQSSYCDCGFDLWVTNGEFFGTIYAGINLQVVGGSMEFSQSGNTVTATVPDLITETYAYSTYYPDRYFHNTMGGFSATYPIETETISVIPVGSNQFKVIPSNKFESWTLLINNNDAECRYPGTVTKGYGDQTIDIGSGNLAPGTYMASVSYDKCPDTSATEALIVSGSCAPPTPTPSPSPTPTPPCEGIECIPCNPGDLCEGPSNPPVETTPPGPTPSPIDITPTPIDPNATPTVNPTTNPTVNPTNTSVPSNTPVPTTTPTPSSKPSDEPDLSVNYVIGVEQPLKGNFDFGTASVRENNSFSTKAVADKPITIIIKETQPYLSGISKNLKIGGGVITLATELAFPEPAGSPDLIKIDVKDCDKPIYINLVLTIPKLLITNKDILTTANLVISKGSDIAFKQEINVSKLNRIGIIWSGKYAYGSKTGEYVPGGIYSVSLEANSNTNDRIKKFNAIFPIAINVSNDRDCDCKYKDVAPPSDRHYLDKIKDFKVTDINSVFILANTKIEVLLLISEDLEEIRTCKAKIIKHSDGRIDFIVSSGRKYRYKVEPNGRGAQVYPIDGPGIEPLSSLEYILLVRFKEFGNNAYKFSDAMLKKGELTIESLRKVEIIAKFANFI